VSFPESKVDRPAIALKGFKRVFVRKGETVHVSIPLKATDLTYWDTRNQKFVLEPGKVKYSLGSYSEDFRLSGEIMIQ
jgi:beta-glucosidase